MPSHSNTEDTGGYFAPGKYFQYKSINCVYLKTARAKFKIKVCDAGSESKAELETMGRRRKFVGQVHLLTLTCNTYGHQSGPQT